MDILTHALSGTAIATCVTNFYPATFLRKFKVIAVGAVGGIFPDFDAISMWSRFDTTFGKVFNLEYSGKVIYGSKFWYSHHAFFHSIFASVLFGLLLISFVYLLQILSSNRKVAFSKFCKNNNLYLVVFILGYWAHLAGDLPTPASAWNGIDLFWPSGNYIGGYGKIWWWNNYDIFLLIMSCVIINLVIPLIFKDIRKRAGIFSACVLALTLSLILVQVNTRQYDYAYSGNTSKYAEYEQNSKREQQRILGKKLYYYMAYFDRCLKFYF